MKFRHLVSFTQSCYLTVDYDMYQLSRAHFSHFSLTKTKASLPQNFVFPKEFCLTQNPKHYSIKEETLKLMDSVINQHLVQTI